MLQGRYLLVVLSFCYTLTASGQPQHNEIVGHAGATIASIPVATKTDTISYALGVTWAHGIARVGKNTISPAFYHGVLAYLHNDKTVMDVYRAEKYLDNKFEKLKYDSAWPSLNMTLRLSDIVLRTPYDTASYALGLAWCRAAKQQGIGTVTPALLRALFTSLTGGATFFDYAAADKYLWAHIETLRSNTFAAIKQQNEQWLATNKTKEGVVALPSGLQYKVIKQGYGRSPATGDKVACNYLAKFIDGIIFESTFADHDGKPLKLFTPATIKGWQQALALMHEGDTWELYIPYHLAYGSGGIKDLVPPFATVIYSLELVKVGE